MYHLMANKIAPKSYVPVTSVRQMSDHCEFVSLLQFRIPILSYKTLHGIYYFKSVKVFILCTNKTVLVDLY
jgi:hypothetical protein